MTREFIFIINKETGSQVFYKTNGGIRGLDDTIADEIVELGLKSWIDILNFFDNHKYWKRTFDVGYIGNCDHIIAIYCPIEEHKIENPIGTPKKMDYYYGYDIDVWTSFYGND
jgi:hypothetical protein